jgi:hypothetical protein
MCSRKTGFAHIRVGLDLRRPFDAVLDVRVRYWLRKFAYLVEQHDTPRGEPLRSSPPDSTDAALRSDSTGR